MEFSRFIIRRHTASVTTDAATQAAMSQTERIPKNHTEHPAAGRSAMITSRIMELTLFFAWAWGELERINFILISSSSLPLRPRPPSLLQFSYGWTPWRACSSA